MYESWFSYALAMFFICFEMLVARNFIDVLSNLLILDAWGHEFKGMSEAIC